MNRLFLILSLLFILIVPQAWGQTNQYPNPNRQTMWNNMTDSMHTIGQTPQQAKLTKWKLHQARLRARVQGINSNAQAKRKAQLQAWRNSQNQ